MKRSEGYGSETKTQNLSAEVYASAECLCGLEAQSIKPKLEEQEWEFT